MNLTQLIQKICKSEGRIVRVTFIKRTNGERRILVGRLGVKKNVSGVGMKYDAPDKALITIFDMQKKQFRMINIPGIEEIRVDGKIYKRS